MKLSSIKKYLRPSTIIGRKSTFSSAFASALAPYDTYDEAKVAEAIKALDQDPSADLQCVYCGRDAATWDHLFNLVTDGNFSGHGHWIRNLVPCCRTCNERKGKKPWRDFLESSELPDKAVRARRIEHFLENHTTQPSNTPVTINATDQDYLQYHQIRSQIFELMQEADRLAVIIRQKIMNPSMK